MFKKHQRDKRTELEKEIDTIIKSLRDMDEETDEYKETVSILDKLVGLDDKIKKSKKDNKNKVSKDTIAVVVGNLAGILLILNFEKANVITSKALSFIIKGRV